MRKNIGLFRGKYDEQWLYGYLTINGNGTCQIWENTDGGFFPAVVNPETVSEYTGLTDKNGVRIFEGDIVQEKYERGIVRFGEYNDFAGKSHVGFYIQWNRAHFRFDILFWIRYRKIEVTSNIYDSPEILGGDDNAAD